MSTNISPERKVVNQAQFATYWQATQQTLSLAEKNANKVDEISAESTREQYPSAKAVYDFNQTTRVTESGDLNDYKTAGTYYFESTVTPTNLPGDDDAGTHGFLYVITSQQYTTNEAIIKQYWHRSNTSSPNNDAHIWCRGYSNAAGWGNWVRIITNAPRTGKYTSQFANNYQMPTFANLINNEELCIPLNANLDDYVTPGTFIAATNEISGSLGDNCPFTQGGFRLFVSIINTSQIVQQILIGHSAESQIFLRQKNINGTWGAWKKIIAEPTGVVQIASGGTGATNADGAKSALGLASFTSIAYSSSSTLLNSLKAAWENVPVAQSFNIYMQSANSVRSSVYGIKKDANNGHMICLLIGSSSDDSDIIQYVVSSGTWTRTDFVVS